MPNTKGLSHEKVASLLTEQFLELIILPTEQCNFRCTYCYEDFSIGKMKKSTVESIKKLIKKRSEHLKQLKIEWFGGEPLVAKDIILDICEFVKKTQIQQPEMEFVSGMTTNGYQLKTELLQKLVTQGVKHYQISLDGTRELHNQTRMMRGGKGSFDRIWSNLLSMRDTAINFQVMLRIHITPDNYEGLPALLNDIKNEFGNDKRFSVFLKAIENLGGLNSGKFSVLRGTQKIQIVDELYAIIGEDMKPAHMKSKDPYVCYASQPNSFVIRATGNLAKCTVALSDERNTIGHLNDDGSLTINHTRLQPWLRGLKSMDHNTLKCPIVGLPKDLGIPVKIVNS